MKKRNSGKVFVCDLTTTAGQSLVWEWSQTAQVSLPHPRAVHAAGPETSLCLTSVQACWASTSAILEAARWAKILAIPCPTPCKQCQLLVCLLVRLVLWCCAHNKIVRVENPRSSLYWRTSFYKRKQRLLMFSARQAYHYGSQRPKWAALAYNEPAFGSIISTCPGASPSHQHLLWGVTPSRLRHSRGNSIPHLPPWHLPYAHS